MTEINKINIYYNKFKFDNQEKLSLVLKLFFKYIKYLLLLKIINNLRFLKNKKH